MPQHRILRGFLRISSNFDLRLGMTLGASTLFILSIFVHPMSANLNSNWAGRASIGPLAVNQNQTIDQKVKIDPQRRAEMIRTEYERRRAKRAAQNGNPKSSGPTWVSIGPFNAAGRITALAPHPTQVGTIYAGADGGGVWKTTDGGASWTPLTDDLSNLNIGAVALAPSSPETIYAGTGSETAFGIGVIKSTDGGATWQIPGQNVGAVFKISVHPDNDRELVIGTTNGAYRSVDGGSSWSPVLNATVTELQVKDLVRDPTNPLILYATTFTGVKASAVKSVDGGMTWSQLTNGLPSTDPNSTELVSNMAITISPANPLVLYAACSIRDTSGIGSHIFKTIDGGQSWADLTGLAADINAGSYNISQAFHHNTIVVSPNNPNIVFGGSTFYVRSPDAGVTWSSITNSNPHFDATDLKYQAGILYIANDGGIWSSHDDGQTFAPLNNNLVAREYYSLAIDPADNNRVLTASQDNGGDRRPDAGGLMWDRFSSDADIYSVEINRDVPSIGYATSFGGFISRLPLSGASTTDDFFANAVTPPYTASENPFSDLFGALLPGQIALDRNNSNIIYTGSSRVWRSVNDGNDWAPLPTTTTDGSIWGTTRIGALAVSGSDGTRLMVGKLSLDLISKGQPPLAVFSSIDGGQTWRRSNRPFNLIERLEYDPRNPEIGYLAGATAQPGVFMTSDGGVTWKQMVNELLGTFVHVVRVDPNDSNVLYSGTDFGVYRSTDQGLSWSSFGEGLPAVRVRDIRILDDGSIIRVATYGRGVWEIQFPSTNHSPTAQITLPTANITVQQGSTVLFNGSVSDVDAGDSVSAIWSFTDTGEQTHTGGVATSASHTFNKGGVFLAALTAVDNHGSRGATQVQVRVSQTFDSCDTPLVFPANGPFPFSITANQDTATTQATDPTNCAGNDRTLWFEFTPATSGTYTITATSTSLPPLFSIWTGSRCGPYDFPGGQYVCDFQPTFSADAGVPLHIMTSFGKGQITLTLSKTGAPCQYALSFASTLHNVRGGSGSVDVLATDQCSWSASSDVDWIRIDRGASGSGRDRVDYFVLPDTGETRIGHLTIAGQPIRIVQSATESINGQIGDVNGDGVIDVGDLVRLANFLAGNSTIDKSLADVFQDNVVDVRDLFTLANFLAGNTHSLPVIPNTSASSATPLSSFATTGVVHSWTGEFKYGYVPAIGRKAS